MAEPRTRPPRWEDQAACRDADPDLFFPPIGRNATALAAAARQICLTCPVIHDCLTHALEHDEHFGIWGGHNRPALRRLIHQAAGRPWPTVARAAIDKLRAQPDPAPDRASAARVRPVPAPYVELFGREPRLTVTRIDPPTKPTYPHRCPTCWAWFTTLQALEAHYCR